MSGSTPAFAGAGSDAPSVNRTYPTFAGARVAMRDGAAAALTYLHGDNLGSASLATSMTGTVLSQQRYKPGACPERQRGGEVRWSSGAGMPTDPSTDRITDPLSAGFTFTLRLRSELALSEAKGQAGW